MDEYLWVYFSKLEKALALPLSLGKVDTSYDTHAQATANKWFSVYGHTPAISDFSTQGFEIADVKQITPTSNLSMVIQHDVHGNIEREGDSSGSIARQSHNDTLGNTFMVTNTDSGTKISLKNRTGALLFTPNIEGSEQRFVYDALRKKVETKVRQKSSDTSEILWGRITCGDEAKDARKRSMIGQARCVAGRAGFHGIEAYDIRELLCKRPIGCSGI